jgi:hypothetical protein
MAGLYLTSGMAVENQRKEEEEETEHEHECHNAREEEC